MYVQLYRIFKYIFKTNLHTYMYMYINMMLMIMMMYVCTQLCIYMYIDDVRYEKYMVYIACNFINVFNSKMLVVVEYD